MTSARRRVLAGILLAAIAAAACQDRGVRPTETTQLRDTADQVMFGMATRIWEKGVLRSVVEADTAYIYQTRQLIDLRGLTMRLYDGQGVQQSTLTAKSGLFNTVVNSLDARGDVVVRANDGRVLRTEHLIYDQTANSIRSDTTFVYDTAEEQVTGTGFTSDIDVRNVRVEQPRGRQRGRGVDLRSR